jgi:hypothetical protein
LICLHGLPPVTIQARRTELQLTRAPTSGTHPNTPRSAVTSSCIGKLFILRERLSLAFAHCLLMNTHRLILSPHCSASIDDRLYVFNTCQVVWLRSFTPPIRIELLPQTTARCCALLRVMRQYICMLAGLIAPVLLPSHCSNWRNGNTSLDRRHCYRTRAILSLWDRSKGSRSAAR